MEFNDVVVTVLVTVLTAVITFLGSEIKKNVRARTIFNVLEPLAKDAVVAAQKLGVTEYLSGAMKKNHAVKSVIKALSDAGFSIKDKQAIENAIEKAYAEQKELLAQYPQKTKEG
ncbi:phage holin [Ligilactobacillus murinus]|uniref:Phage holin n=1 Tax=Ligilactobacillus murinus TaxID=1622 RepID=A0A4Q2AZF6_9LACO|nr:phage holin [Ligilactobacillus murinus]NBH84884.1 phage holin [Lachnospiraceae bacterium]RXV75240.1 phage holin [Ligilactobacillus murinus]